MALEGFTIGAGSTPSTPAASIPMAAPKTSGALSGFKIGATAPQASEAPAPAAQLPTELPQPKQAGNIFSRTLDTVRSLGVAKLTGTAPKGAKSMIFPVANTDLKPQDLDAALKDLDTKEKQIATMRSSVDLNDQKSVDDYNAKIETFQKDSDAYNKNADTLNAVAKAHQALGISLYPGTDKNEATIGPDLGKGVDANEFENARMKAGYPSWLVRNSFTKIVDPIIEDSLKKGETFVRTLDSAHTPAQRFGAGLEAVAGLGNALFAPISGIIGVASEKSDLVGLASQVLSVPGQLASTVTGMAVASLPISQKTKDDIAPGLQDIASLVADILAAEKAGKEITPEIKEKIGMVKDKIADVKTAVTKDIVTRYTPNSTAYFDATKVKDIWQTQSLLTDSEKSDILGTIGTDKAKVKDAIKNGISIEVSPRELVTLQDKPYWAKIKKYFGIESVPEVIKDVGATARQTVRGYLPAAGNSAYNPVLHPALKNDIADALETHDAATVKQELVDQLHVPQAKADAIVRKIQQEAALKDPKQLAQEILQLAAPESKGQIEAPKAFGGSKIEINKTAEEKAIEEKVHQGILKNGGVTINTKGEQPTKGYSYAPDKTTEFSVSEADYEQNHEKYIADFREKNKELLSDPENHIGGWIDNGRVYLDISRVGDASAETIAKAQAAKQLGVYDLEHGMTIPTGQLAENGNMEYTPIDEATNVYDKHQREISGTTPKGAGGGDQKILQSEEGSGGGNQKIKPVGGGEKVASELASGIEARAIEKKLTDKPFSSLSMHERAVMEEQRDTATELYKTDPEKAKAIALGEANAPEGLLPSVVYQKVVTEAEKAGDIDLMMKLATSPFNDEITAMAQNLRGLAEFRNKTSPTEIIKQVTKARKAAVEKKSAKAGSIEKAKEKIVERAKKQIAKRKSPIQLKDVEAFINLMEC